jgi:hypothetical protein
MTGPGIDPQSLASASIAVATGCAVAPICRVDSFVADALGGVLIGLQAVEAFRPSVVHLIEGKIARLQNGGSESEKLAALILTQYVRR